MTWAFLMDCVFRNAESTAEPYVSPDPVARCYARIGDCRSPEESARDKGSNALDGKRLTFFSTDQL